MTISSSAFSKKPFVERVQECFTNRTIILGLDVDGTLLNNERTHQANFEFVAREFGFEARFDWVALTGKGEPFVLNWMEEQQEGFKLSESETEDFMSQYRFLNEQSSFEARPEMLLWFTELRKLGYPIGIFTGSPYDVARKNLTTAGYNCIADDIPFLSASDPDIEKKPNPMGYRKLESQLSSQHNKTHLKLTFEDSEAGCISALKAGWHVVHITDVVPELDQRIVAENSTGGSAYISVTPDNLPQFINTLLSVPLSNVLQPPHSQVKRKAALR